jgi:hypothetical protein
MKAPLLTNFFVFIDFKNNVMLLGANTHKGANGITSQNNYESFLILFSIFHMKEFLNEAFCNLLLKINKNSLIDHLFCVNHC